MNTLLQLAERCGKATGPSLDLDHEIGQALSANGNYSYRPYTASIDAALDLVPERFKDDWLLTDNGAFLGPDALYWSEGEANHYSYADTPALALCAAALKARAASAIEAPSGVETAQTGSTEGESAVGATSAETPKV